MQPWGFYGRQRELADLRAILERGRWFFVQVSGRRRIGKTSLIQQALNQTGRQKRLYIQIPDSDPTGVLVACNDYLETFGIKDRVRSLGELAQLIAKLAEQGYVIALDEFQYFSRKPLFDFCSLLQAEIDALSARADRVKGGLIVLGSLHAEMATLLDDRAAPLFNRSTDKLMLDHLDVASLLEMLHIRDNFLRSWLAALQRPVSAVHFSPEAQLIAQADQLLAEAEGSALEELAGRLYEETSRKGLSDFPLSERIKGYWDRAGIEIDLVAVSESTRRIRFGTCKRGKPGSDPN